jgi:hypothetical protein
MVFMNSKCIFGEDELEDVIGILSSRKRRHFAAIYGITLMRG